MLFTRFEVGPGAILAPEAQERRRIRSGSYKGERIFQIFFDTVGKFRLFGGFDCALIRQCRTIDVVAE